MTQRGSADHSPKRDSAEHSAPEGQCPKNGSAEHSAPEGQGTSTQVPKRNSAEQCPRGAVQSTGLRRAVQNTTLEGQCRAHCHRRVGLKKMQNMGSAEHTDQEAVKSRKNDSGCISKMSMLKITTLTQRGSLDYSPRGAVQSTVPHSV